MASTAEFIGRPSSAHELCALVARGLKATLTPFGGVLAMVRFKIPFISDSTPPLVLTRGLSVTHTRFADMPIVTFTPPEASGKVVVAIHGGAYVGEATIFHWWTYRDLARQTGATVVVPGYTLSPAGTAASEVPQMSTFIEEMVDEHGAENVSVLGDSAGGGFAMLAIQDLVRREVSTPGRLVLLAPWLDVSMSDPRSAAIDDPLLDTTTMTKNGTQWAGELHPQYPRASPLFGSLEGLPATVVYTSSRDRLVVDALRLRERVLAEHVSTVTFRLRRGLLHDFAIYAPLSDARAERANLFGDLGLASSTKPEEC